MLYYHGTTRRAAEAIQREGLKPHRETAFQLQLDDGIELRTKPGEDEQVVYVTKYKTLAQQFAMFRAEYEMAEPGATIESFSFPQQIKSPNAKSCNCVEEPVVIALDVPEEIYKQFEGDIQDHRARICTCVIGPEHIVSVENASLRNIIYVSGTDEDNVMWEESALKRGNQYTKDEIRASRAMKTLRNEYL